MNYRSLKEGAELSDKLKYIILFTSVFITVCGQTLMKVGGSSVPLEKNNVFHVIISYIKSPLIVGGFFLSAVAAFMWTYCLARFDFNYAYFIGSLSYIFVILISLFFFKENISPVRWVGCGLIFTGVLIVIKG